MCRGSGAVALRSEPGERPPSRGNLVDASAMVSVAIRELPLCRAAHERLVFHLAVHIEQRFAELSQRLHGHGLTVDVRARTPIGADHAPEHALAIVLEG